MAMLYGSDDPQAFVSAEEHRRLWFEHRTELLRCTAPGRRPDAWWAYETTLPYPGRDLETEALRKLGELTAAEERELFGVTKPVTKPTKKPRARRG
jgi:hypothetical protein